jgi:pyridoxal phosphate enzyme (YggS family)
MPPTVDAGVIADRHAQVRDRIAAAARRAGRAPEDVTLVVVTKTFPAAAIRAVAAAGAGDVGESYVQEAVRKIEELAVGGGPIPPLRWHLIGHLQRNKAAPAAHLFDLIHSVDGEALGGALDRAAAALGKVVPVLVEVNVGGEATKHGISPAAAPALLASLGSLAHLRIEGLMAVPPPAPHTEASRPHFRALARLRADLARRGFDLPRLSMGMSDDYEVAVEEGATIVRVGRAILGAREVP